MGAAHLADDWYVRSRLELVRVHGRDVVNARGARGTDRITILGDQKDDKWRTISGRPCEIALK